MTGLFNNPGFYMTYAVIQAVLVLIVIRYLDLYQRQPLSLLALMAAWGATGAALIALAGNEAFKATLDPDAREVFGNAIAPPIVEEAAKGIALIAAIGPIRWFARRLGVTIFEGVGSGIVYGAAVGLGFAFTEDFFYFIDQARQHGLENGLDVFIYRRDFFGPAVLNHPVFTAAFGAGLGLAAWSKGWVPKVVYPALGFMLAVVMHALNNGLVESVLVIKYGLAATADWARGTVLIPAIQDTADKVNSAARVLDFYFLALFLLAMALWVRYERKVIRRELAEEVGSGLLTQDEFETTFDAEKRWSRDWRLVKSGQWEQWRNLGRIRDQLFQLALAKWRVHRFGGDMAQVQRLRRQIATLETFDVRESNLPEPSTPLVGRERELEELGEMLGRAETRLVTLLGPGGTGKTRLSIEVASRLRDDFGSGVFFVELAAIRDPALVPAAVAEVLEVAEKADEPLLDTLQDYLRDKQMLLVLDNFEQVTDASPAVAELLGAAPRLKAIASSREPLRLTGEHAYPVPPLEQGAAQTLFEQRARAADPAFAITEANAAPVEEICRRLDGLPLAIELASARVKTLSPQMILDRLDEPLRLLSAGARDLPERHQTLFGTIDWSYELLDESEQALLGRLSVFSGGCRLDAAEVVCGGVDVLDGLTSLVEKSLVVREQAAAGELRFRMLETIREYAAERAEEDLDGLRRRHASWFTAFAEEAEPQLLSPAQERWLQRLSEENGNIREALAWSLASGEVERGLRLAGALVRFWSIRGLMGEGRRWLDEALERAAEVDPRVRAKALFAAGYAALGQGDFSSAEESFGSSLELAREVQEGRLEGAALAQLGWLAMARGSDEQAHEAATEGLRIAREHGDSVTASGALSVLAEVEERRRDPRATELYDESLSLRRALGDQRLVANSLLNLARAELGRGRSEHADELSQEALELARRLRDTWSISVALTNLARVRLLDDDANAAEPLLTEAMRLARERGDRRVIGECLQGFAVARLVEGHPRPAARLWGAAEAMREEIGARESAPERLLDERFLPALQTELDGDRLEHERAIGRTLSPEDAVSAT